MERHIVIFVTDKRQQYISEFLSGSTQTGIWKDEESEQQCLAEIRRATQIILPTPMSKLEKTGDISEILKYNLVNCRTVFGGKIGKEWRRWFLEHGIACVDLMEDETVALENAYVTAEGTVAEILKHSDYSIRDQKIVVTGYGRCGKCVANLLKSMGAKVTVLARSVEARKKAKADGHNAADFSYGAEEAYGTRTFVNTVPAMVVTEHLIAEMHKDAVIIDLASAPGGTDLAAAEKYGISVVSALGLPGRYTTKSSAKILADAIQRGTLPKPGEGEDRSWIFRIII